MPEEINCKTCHDDHYYWDTLVPCHDCEPGRALQHELDKRDLKMLEKQVKTLRKKIKEYDQPLKRQTPPEGGG